MKALWNNRVTRLLDCQYPILLAGMGGVARHELAAAVARAGGFGCLGMVRESPELIAREVQALRRLSNRPFGVNLIPAATPAPLLRRQLRVCLDLKVPVIVLFWDVHAGLIADLKRAGVIVLHQVGSEDDAREALIAGVDGLIAQGTEAGGHVRGRLATSTLVTQLARFSPVPVIASGGVANGRDLMLMRRHGAEGVSCGTAFLATHESYAHDFHKRQVVQAGASDTVLTRVFWKNWHQAEPVRVLRNALTDAQDAGDACGDEVIGEQDGQPIYRNSTDSPLRDAQGKLHLMPLYAGKSCSGVLSIVSAGERLARMVKEAERELDRFDEPYRPAGSVGLSRSWP